MNTRLHALLSGLLLSACATAMAQDVELFDQPNFGGIRLALSVDAADLSAWGLGRRTASVIVKRGQWEFCTQPNHGGTCITVGPGRYAELPSALRGNVASTRMAGRTNTGTPPVAPQPQPPQPLPQPQPGVPGPVVPGFEALSLFEESNFSGARVGLSGAVTHLSNHEFNDRARSIEIRRGRWQLCEHADFGGECQVLPPGRHVLQGRLHGKVSSLRPVFGANNQPLPAFGGVVLYEHSDFTGRELMLSQVTTNLNAHNFNDRVSSIEVLAGRWEFCTDADFSGRCFVLGPGRHNLDKSLNDKISSLRPR